MLTSPQISPGLQEGVIFAGRYRVIRLLGAGAMGMVHEVLHLGIERRCALKVMLPHMLDREDLRERFKREAKVAAQVKSEFVVDVLDAGVDDGTGAPFLVMELLRGEDLGQRVKRTGRLRPEETVRYLHQTALALDRMHAALIVHRDLKPANLFLAVGEDGETRIKVLDFGVVKFLAEGTAAGTNAAGTPLYMAPEQFRGGKVTGAADIYALGMIAYTLLVGQAYWAEELNRGGNVFTFGLTAIRGPEERATVQAARGGVSLPIAFDPWFAKAAAVEPSTRFATAREAVSELAVVMGVEVFTEDGLPGAIAAAEFTRTGMPADPLIHTAAQAADNSLPFSSEREATVTLTATEMAMPEPMGAARLWIWASWLPARSSSTPPARR